MIRNVVLFLVALILLGCVERTLIIRTDPEAEVYVDGEARGTTDDEQTVRVPFEAYGTRTIVVRREGHVPTRQSVELEVPWYQYFPLDLITDVLWPGVIQDEHVVTIELTRRGASQDPEQLAGEARHFATREEQRP